MIIAPIIGPMLSFSPTAYLQGSRQSFTQVHSHLYSFSHMHSFWRSFAQLQSFAQLGSVAYPEWRGTTAEYGEGCVLLVKDEVECEEESTAEYGEGCVLLAKDEVECEEESTAEYGEGCVLLAKDEVECEEESPDPIDLVELLCCVCNTNVASQVQNHLVCTGHIEDTARNHYR